MGDDWFAEVDASTTICVVPLRPRLRDWLIAEAELRLRQLANREAKVRRDLLYDLRGVAARKLAAIEAERAEVVARLERWRK